MGNLHSPKVLYVDDDPVQMEMCGLLLRSGGFDVISLDLRASGLETLRERSVDLILMDAQQHPLEDRVQIARALRRNYPGAPILLLTDHWASDEDPIPETVPNVWRCDVARLVTSVRERLTQKSRK